MFLPKTINTRPRLIECAKELHASGQIIPDTYILDVDMIIENAKLQLEAAKANGVELFFMLKQIGRNPYIGKLLQEMGYAGAVVVDYKEALVMIDNNIHIGNVGHLVQVPRSVLEKIILSQPEFFTVFSMEIMAEINAICIKHNLTQKVMLKVIDFENDFIYEGQYGGFELKDLTSNFDQFKSFKNLDICGLTAFPCILKDAESGKFGETPNAITLKKAQAILNENGFNITIMNMPSASSTYSMELLNKLGATHGEPGHAITGTTPHHNDITTGEQVAMIYVTEVSHSLDGESYCYGGGHYRRSHVDKALVEDQLSKVTPPSDESIDYYFKLSGEHHYGQTVLMNFRTQIFVTRSHVALVTGIESDNPQVIGIYDSQGNYVQ